MDLTKSDKALELSVGAGILIGIGGSVNLAVGGVAGPILFSLGLLTILYFQALLYTGKVGYAERPKDFLFLFYIWLGNLVGAMGTGVLVKATSSKITMAAQLVCESKLQTSHTTLLFKAVMCGFLMFVAVESFKRLERGSTAQVVMIVFPISVFILCGFEHCVADMFYFGFLESSFMSAILRLLTITLGNTIGSLAARKLIG